MARNSKKVTAPEAEVVAPEVVAVTTGPFAGLGAQPTAPAATAHAVMVAKAQANGMQATIAGATVKAAANIAARGANLQKVPAQIASTTYVLAKVPKVRATAASNYTVQGLAGWVATCCELTQPQNCLSAKS